MPDRRGPGGPSRGREHETTTRFLPSRSRRLGRRHQRHTWGARGYVTRTSPDPTRRRHLPIAAATSSFRPVWRFVLDAFSTAQGDQPVVIADRTSTTDRARTPVLRLIGPGYSYKDVAKELTIIDQDRREPCLVRSSKLQLSSRYQLSHWARSATSTNAGRRRGDVLGGRGHQQSPEIATFSRSMTGIAGRKLHATTHRCGTSFVGRESPGPH